MLTQVGQGNTRRSGQSIADLGHRAVEGHHIGVDLDPVARGEHQRLVDVLTAAHRNGERGSAGRVQGDRLKQGDRGRTV